VLIGGSGPAFTLKELADAGVRRVSLGSALSRAALGAVKAAARELLDTGTTSFAKAALPYAEAQKLMAG
jgi:2-methylisocitrate lyase-like PEP mutase family enzyme